MTKKRRKELLNQFSTTIAALKDDYLPRNRHLNMQLAELADELGEKPLTLGCGACAVKDAKRILKALEGAKTKVD